MICVNLFYVRVNLFLKTKMDKPKRILSLFIVITMIANVIIGGVMIPKRVNALGPDGDDALNIYDVIKNSVRDVWREAKDAWEKENSIVGTMSAVTSSIANKITAAAAWWEKQNTWYTKLAKVMWNVLRKKLLDSLVNSIIKWIQGGKSPHFVTDWKRFLQDAASEGIGAFIEGSDLAFLCSDISVPLKIALGTVPPFQEQVGCTLDKDIIPNIVDFYNDINEGGWDGWLTVTQSNNNFQGVYWGALGEKMHRAAVAVGAAENEANSAGGFLSQKQCMEWDCPDGNFEECMSWEGSKESKCREEACECVGGWKIVTPGQTLASAASKAVNLDIDWLISAKEFEEYAGAIFDAVVNRVTREGLSAMKSDEDGKYGAYERKDVTKGEEMFECELYKGKACMCADPNNTKGSCMFDSSGKPITSFAQIEDDMNKTTQNIMDGVDNQSRTNYYNTNQSSSDTKSVLLNFKQLAGKLRWQLINVEDYAREQYESSVAMKFCAEYKYDRCGDVVPERTLKFVRNDETCTTRCMKYVQSFFQCDTVPPLIQDPDAPLIPNPEWPADSEDPAPLIKDPDALIPDPDFESKKCLCENRKTNTGLCKFDPSDKPIVVIDQIPENDLQNMLDECYQPIADNKNLLDFFKEQCNGNILYFKNQAASFFDNINAGPELDQMLGIASVIDSDKSVAEYLLYKVAFHGPFDECVERKCSSSDDFNLCEKNVLSKDGVCLDQLSECNQSEPVECQRQLDKCDPEELEEGITCQSQFDTCKEDTCQSQFDICEKDVSSEVDLKSSCYDQEVKIDFIDKYEPFETCIIDECTKEGEDIPSAICRSKVSITPQKGFCQNQLDMCTTANLADGFTTCEDQFDKCKFTLQDDLDPPIPAGKCYKAQFVPVNYDDVMTNEDYILTVDDESLLQELLRDKMPVYSELSADIEFNLQEMPLDGEKCFNGEEMPSLDMKYKVNEYEKEHWCITREMNKCAYTPWFKMSKLEWTGIETYQECYIDPDGPGQICSSKTREKKKSEDIISLDIAEEHFVSNFNMIEGAIYIDNTKCEYIGEITDRKSCLDCPPSNNFYYCDINTNGEEQEDGTNVWGWVDWWGNAENSEGVQIWDKIGGEWDNVFNISVAPEDMQAIFDQLDAL